MFKSATDMITKETAKKKQKTEKPPPNPNVQTKAKTDQTKKTQ